MKRILVVEDDVIICGGVKLFLEKRGYEVETAYSCKEADGCLEHGFDSEAVFRGTSVSADRGSPSKK